MPMPKAYQAEQGYKYQILALYNGRKEYDHLDYAEDNKDLKHLMENYRMGMDKEFSLKVITLPKKYWRKTSEQGVLKS